MSILSLSLVNCVASRATEPEAKAAPQSSNDKLLGLYDFKDIFTLKFSFTGGLSLIKPPQVTVTFSSGLPATANVTVFDQSGNFKCSNIVNIDPSVAQQLVTASLPLNLGIVPQTMSIAVDCGVATLEIEMKDSSTHAYKFNSICSAPGELNIFDPQDGLTSKIDAMITAYATCP